MKNNIANYTHQIIIDRLLEGKDINRPYQLEMGEFKKFSNVQLCKMIEAFGIPEGQNYWRNLASDRDAPEVFKLLNENGFDLMEGGGMLLFQAAIELKRRNVDYLASISEVDSRSVYLSIINIPGVLSNQKKPIEDAKPILTSLMKRITPEFYREEILPNLKKDVEFFNDLFLSVCLPENQSNSIAAKPKI